MPMILTSVNLPSALDDAAAIELAASRTPRLSGPKQLLKDSASVLTC